MRRILVVLLLAVLPAALPLTARGQTGDGLTIRLLDAPENRREDPRARLYIVDHLNQGERLERRIEVSNRSGAPLDVAMYAAAASVSDSEFRFGEDRAANELTSWTTVEPGVASLAPGAAVVATVTIAVPEDAIDGERFGVIWAETKATGGNVSAVSRVGIRMYVSVGEGEEPPTDFEIEALTAARDDSGTPIVRTRVTNTGGRAIDVRGELRLTNGPGSVSAGPFPIEIGTTLGPQERAAAEVRLARDLPAGPWEAIVEVTTGELTKQAKGTITFPDAAGEEAQPVRAELVDRERRILVPIAVGLAVLVLIALLLVSRRARRPQDDGADGAAS